MCPIILRNCEGLWDNPFSPCKIIRRKQNGLVLKTKSKQITEKENRNKRERDGLPGHLPVAGPAHWPSPPGASCRLPPASRSSCVLARARPRRPAPPCLPAASPTRLDDATRHPGPSLPLPRPSRPLLPLRSAPEHPVALRRAPPQPRPSPSPTTVTNSSARTRSISSTSHASRVSPQHHHRCLLQPRDRRPSPSNSSAPDRPRPRRASPRHRCEPLTTYPCSLDSSCRIHRSPPCQKLTAALSCRRRGLSSNESRPCTSPSSW